jgi:hypothetical protein
MIFTTVRNIACALMLFAGAANASEIFAPQIDTSSINSYSDYENVRAEAYKKYDARKMDAWRTYDQTKSEALHVFTTKRYDALRAFRAADRDHYFEYLDAEALDEFDRMNDLESRSPAMAEFRKAIGDADKEYEAADAAAWKIYQATDKEAWKTYEAEKDMAYKAYRDAASL